MIVDKRFSSLNSQFDIERSEHFTPSPVSVVRWTKLPDGGYKFNSDIYLLINQKRIVKTLGASTFQSWLDSFQDSDLGSIDTSRFTDGQLLSFVKSRYIQAPCELRAWSQYLNDNAQKIIDDYNAEVERVKTQQQDIISSAQNTGTSSPTTNSD